MESVGVRDQRRVTRLVQADRKAMVTPIAELGEQAGISEHIPRQNM